MKQQKAFTLVELLVVISIIGLLASMMLVNTSSARDKAKIVKSVSFSQQIYRALGSEVVGYWDFNEIINVNQIKDVSGNGNIGTVSGATLADSLTFSGGNFGKALSFNGQNDKVNAGKGAVLDLTSAVTIEGWVYPTGNYAAILRKGGVYGLSWRANDLQFAIYNSTSGWWTCQPSLTLVTGQWSHLVATYSTGDKTARMYRNGGLVDSCTNANADASIGIDGNDLTLGYQQSGSALAGLLDEVRIYSKALSLAEIQKHYAQGLEKRKISAMIK